MKPGKQIDLKLKLKNWEPEALHVFLLRAGDGSRSWTEQRFLVQQPRPDALKYILTKAARYRLYGFPDPADFDPRHTAYNDFRKNTLVKFAAKKYQYFDELDEEEFEESSGLVPSSTHKSGNSGVSSYNYRGTTNQAAGAGTTGRSTSQQWQGSSSSSSPKKGYSSQKSSQKKGSGSTNSRQQKNTTFSSSYSKGFHTVDIPLDEDGGSTTKRSGFQQEQSREPIDREGFPPTVVSNLDTSHHVLEPWDPSLKTQKSIMERGPEGVGLPRFASPQRSTQRSTTNRSSSGGRPITGGRGRSPSPLLSKAREYQALWGRSLGQGKRMKRRRSKEEIMRDLLR